MSSESSTPLVSVSSTVGNGVRVNRLGFGTFNLEGETATKAVHQAIKQGFRTIDCAPVYENESDVGKGLAMAFADDGLGVKREQLTIQSKVWPTAAHPSRLKAAVERSISELQCGYLDVLLLHWPGIGPWVDMEPMVGMPVPFPLNDDGASMQQDPEGEGVDLLSVWNAMAELTKTPLVRSLGVCNCTNAVLDVLMMQQQAVKPVVAQVESSIRCERSCDVRRYQAPGLVLQGYGPFGCGMGDGTSDVKPLTKIPEVDEIAAKKFGVPVAEALLCVTAKMLEQESGSSSSFSLLTSSSKPERIETAAKLSVSALKEDAAASQMLPEFVKWAHSDPVHRHRGVNPTQFCAKPNQAYFSEAQQLPDGSRVVKSVADEWCEKWLASKKVAGQ